MPSPSFLNELSEEDAKTVLIEICRSQSSAQNLERIIRCLLHFWDPARCALLIDKDFVPEIFSDLKYGPEAVENADISTLSILDIKVFLHLCLHCAHVRSERMKVNAGTNTRKFPIRSTPEQLTTEWQRSWWRAAWSLSHGAGKQEDRIRLQEGLDTLRLKSRDTPELPLLLSVAAMLENEVPDTSRYSGTDAKAASASDYGKLYWTTIDQILERDRIIQPKPDAMFYAGLPPLPRSRRDHYRSLASYYRALNALQHGKDDEGVTILEQLQTPQAFFALAQIYKSSAEKVVGRQGDQDVELRRRALLIKAKEALQSAMEILNSQASNGGVADFDVAKSIEEVNASLAAATLAASAVSPVSGPASASALSNNGAVTPIASSTMGFATPSSRYATPMSFSGNNTQASASLLMELGQSVDYALRALTHSQETLVRGIMDQNRALTNTCDSVIAQMKELTLTNKALVEEMKEVRRENAEYRLRLTTVDSPVSRSHRDESYRSPQTTPASHPIHSTPASHPTYYQQMQPQPIQQISQPLQQLQQHCQQVFSNQQQQPGFLPQAQVPKMVQMPTMQPSVLEQRHATSTPLSASTAPVFPPQSTSTVFVLAPPKLPFYSSPSSAPAVTIAPVIATTNGSMSNTSGLFSGTIFGSSKPTTGPNVSTLGDKNASSGAPFQSFPSFKGYEGAGTPVFGGGKTAPPEHSRQESENDDSLTAETPYEPTAEFKPLIPLPALVEVKSGEEDEEVLFKERAKLYRWGLDVDGKEGFRERGLGDLKILKHRETGRVRILMRREQILKICANHSIQPGMKLSPMQKSDRVFTWHCQDFSDGEVKGETLAVRFKELEQAKKFKDIFESAVAASEFVSPSKSVGSDQKDQATISDKTKESQQKKDEAQGTPKEQKPPLSTMEMFKPKPGSWACKDCYTRNEEGSMKCDCCGTAGPNAPPSTSTPVSAQSTAPAFPSLSSSSVFGSSPPKFGLPPTVTNPPQAPANTIAATTATTNGSSVTTSDSFPAPIFGASKPTTGLSFSTLASSAGASSAPFQSFQGFKGFEGAGKPLFGGVKTTTPERPRQESENDDSLTAETPFEPTAEFKPLIPLPALVEVKSGEEDEEVLFKERAKLYRWGLDVDGKEGFRERGLGDLKILKHRETGRVRILMRREQVLKICANHGILPGMKLSPMQRSDRAFTWHCQDFSDGEVKGETLAVRFKEMEQAKKFKDIFESTVAALESVSPSKSVGSDQKDQALGTDKTKESQQKMDEQKPPLSTMEMFKPKPGSWACNDCYTRNEEGAMKCVCCGSASPNAPPSTSAPAFPAQSTAPALPSLSSSSVFGLSPPKFGLPDASNPTLAPATIAAAGVTTDTAKGSANSGGSFPAPIFGASKPTTGLNFSALAANNASSSASATPFQSFQGFKGFEGAGKSVFGGGGKTPEHTRKESENDDSSETPFEPTAEFKPLIPLPALVEAKSGEEDEEVLFKERAKLYRWGSDVDGKLGFKERGLGDLKILKHRETGRVRILMRREQILKICANHGILPGMKLSPMQKSDRAFTWHCQDFSDGEVKDEMLAVRFKEVEQARKFKEIFEAAAESSGNNMEPIGKGAGDYGKASLEKEVKTTPEEEVSVIYEAKANEKEESLAEKYMLPKSFYIEHSPCPGCIGCASDEAQEKILRQLDRQEE